MEEEKTAFLGKKSIFSSSLKKENNCAAE